MRGRKGGREESLSCNLLLVEKYNLKFLSHPQRDASLRQTNHLQNYHKELALSYPQAQQR